MCIAEELQFVRAAQKLFISQSALSQQIKLLEQELGVELFDQRKRKVARLVELTEAGKVLLKDAKKILDQHDKAIAKVKLLKTPEKAINLGVYRMLHGQLIIDTMALIANNLPDLEIKLIEFDTHISVQEALLNETIDLGVTVMPLIFEQLDAKLLRKSELLVLLPQSHRLATADVIQLADLKDENWIEINNKIHPIYEQIEDVCYRVGFERSSHIVQEVSSLDLVGHFVGLKKGIAFVPAFFDTSSFTNVVRKKIADTAFEFEQCLAWRSQNNLLQW